MSKYKIVHAFALKNSQFLKRLEYYSSQGWHYKKWLVFFIVLEKGEPKNYRYELVYDKKFTKEKQEFYQANGWKLIRNSFFWQILRGESNAVDLYTNNIGEVEMWKYRLKFTLKLNLICIFITILILLGSEYSVMEGHIFKFIQGMFCGGTTALVFLNIYFYIKYKIAGKGED